MSLSNVGAAAATLQSGDELLERALHDFNELGAQYAQARSELEHVQQYRKSKKALLMAEAERSGITSAAKCEVFAYSSSEYIQLLDALKEATEVAERLKWELECKRMRFEAWRSKQATRRAEINIR